MLKLLKADVPYILAGLAAAIMLSLMLCLTAVNFGTIIQNLTNEGSGKSIKTSTGIFVCIGSVSAMAVALQVDLKKLKNENEKLCLDNNIWGFW